MERLTEEKQIGPFAALKDKAEAAPGAFATYDCLYAHMVAVTHLKGYEDAMSLERAQELIQAEKDGRLVVLPEVPERDRKFFVDGLWDYFQEASLCDPSTGIFGMSEGEKELASALMNALTHHEAEAALKKIEGTDNEAD